MRILHVDSGRTWRGGQAQVLHLVRGLRERGHTQLVAAPGGSPLFHKAGELGVAVRDVPVRGDLDARAIMRLQAAARDVDAEVIHAHTASAHAAAMAAGRMAQVRVRIVTRRCELKVGGHFLSRVKYRHAGAHYIAISPHVAAALRSAGVPPERIDVVYSGVPVAGMPGVDDPGSRRFARTALGLPAEAPIIGCVGALSREKGQDIAVAALKGLPAPARLVLIGDGPERGALEIQARREGLANRVVFAGFQKDVSLLWPAFDVGVAPSRHEGLGTAVIEAMAAGVPVVAARIGAFASVLEDGAAGRLVPPEDPDALATAIAGLIQSPAERKALTAAGRKRALDFTVERMLDGNESVYDRLHRGGASLADDPVYQEA